MYDIPDLFKSREEARAFGRECSHTQDMGKLASKLEGLVVISNSYLNKILGNQLLFQDAYTEYKRNTNNEY